jgi:hypothetical protein
MFIDFCNSILQDLSSCNFIQDNDAQARVWSSLMHRSTQDDSYKIYFVFL